MTETLRMKFDCPSCREPTFGGFAKYRSRRETATRCGVCGQLAAEPSDAGDSVALFGIVMLGAGILFGWNWKSWAPVILAVTVTILLEIASFYLIPLQEVHESGSPESVDSRTSVWVPLVFCIAALVLALALL